jgi:poly(A) polymerase
MSKYKDIAAKIDINTSRIDIDDPILLKIGEIADSENIRVFAVGGFVRDHFLKRSRKDIDCTVLGDPIDFAKKVASHFNSKIVLFEKYRTAMVPVGDYHVNLLEPEKRNILKIQENQ